MGKKLTKANLKRQEELRASIDGYQNRIFACGGYNERLSECRAKAPAELVKAYDDANSALWAWERQMSDEGRGWLDSSYRFSPY